MSFSTVNDADISVRVISNGSENDVENERTIQTAKRLVSAVDTKHFSRLNKSCLFSVNS